MMIPQNKTASEYLLDTSREYSLYVCQNRAIPQVTDGLKNGQRQALWIMRNKADKIKVISLSGSMISSELYLHGDASASQTISLMAAPYCNNIPLLQGEGTFGTRVSPVDGIGASRYVSVRRTKITDILIYPDLDIVPLKDNHDGSCQEPITFLPIIPTVLLNGIIGISVGWSTSILPRNINDIIDATISALDEQPITQIPVCYDYLNITTKCLGDNTWEFTGKVQIVDTSTIRVVELPPNLSLKEFKEFLIGLEAEDKINDWSDLSTKTICVEVKFKRGSITGWTEEQAIEFLKIKSQKKERIVVIDWNGSSITQYENAEELVKDFVIWRLTWYIKRYEKLLADTKYDLNFWNGVKLCFDEKLPDLILSIKNRKELLEAVSAITTPALLTNEQNERIVEFATYRWTQESYDACIKKISELEKLRDKYMDLLAKPDKIKAIFRQEVMNLKKEKFK